MSRTARSGVVTTDLLAIFIMYDEMTNADLIWTAHEKAHPSDNPSSENADLIDELCSRLRKVEKELREMEEDRDYWCDQVSC